MRSVRLSRLVSRAKFVLSSLVILIGLLMGVLAIALCADMPTFAGYFEPELSRVAAIALLGFTSVVASIIALRQPRTASFIFLSAAPIVGACFAWWLRFPFSEYEISLRRVVLVFTGTSLLLLIPGAYWLATSRAGWASVIPKQREQTHWPLFIGIVLFVLCLFFGLIGSLYVDNKGYADCKPFPASFTPRFPDHVVFVGGVLLNGNPSHPLCLLRVRQRFWGLPRWLPFAILRGCFDARDGSEYFVDARRSQGLITHSLPLVDRYPCSHAAPIDRAAADLRVLKDGPPKSGVRIIGTVHMDLSRTSEPARGVEVIITGPSGSTRTMTDQQGVYDTEGLPEGHYSVRVGPRGLCRDWHCSSCDAEGDVKSGQVWGAGLIDYAARRARP